MRLLENSLKTTIYLCLLVLAILLFLLAVVDSQYDVWWYIWIVAIEAAPIWIVVFILSLVALLSLRILEKVVKSKSGVSKGSG